MTHILIKLSPYIIFLILGFTLFPSSGRDDVHITYWTAFSLSEHDAILNYNGEHIEQSSSLLHTILLALIKKITTFELATIGSIFSISFGMLNIFLSAKLANLLFIKSINYQIIVATTLPLIYWSYGGLETSLVATIVTLIIYQTCKLNDDYNHIKHILLIAGILFYLLARPESIFILSAFFLTLIVISIIKGIKLKRILITLIFTLLFFGIITTFRLYYFDSYFPQPVYSKIGLNLLDKLDGGVKYYEKSIKHFPLLILLITAFVLMLVKNIKEILSCSKLIIIFSFLLSYNAFIITSGGDWMEGARFFAPIISPYVLAGLIFYEKYFSYKRIFTSFILINLITLLWFARHNSTSSTINHVENYYDGNKDASSFSFFEVSNRIHYRDIVFLPFLESVIESTLLLKEKPTMLSTQAGMVPFYIFQSHFENLNFIDLAALSTRHFTDCQITNTLDKKRTGISISYEFLLSHKNELKNQCSIELPDIIYDLDNKTLDRVKLLTGSGLYQLLYIQKGNICNTGIFKGKKVLSNQFIVVRTDIATKMNIAPIEKDFTRCF